MKVKKQTVKVVQFVVTDGLDTRTYKDMRSLHHGEIERQCNAIGEVINFGGNALHTLRASCTTIRNREVALSLADRFETLAALLRTKEYTNG